MKSKISSRNPNCLWRQCCKRNIIEKSRDSHLHALQARLARKQHKDLIKTAADSHFSNRKHLARLESKAQRLHALSSMLKRTSINREGAISTRPVGPTLQLEQALSLHVRFGYRSVSWRTQRAHGPLQTICAAPPAACGSLRLWKQYSRLANETATVCTIHLKQRAT